MGKAARLKQERRRNSAAPPPSPPGDTTFKIDMSSGECDVIQACAQRAGLPVDEWVHEQVKEALEAQDPLPLTRFTAHVDGCLPCAPGYDHAQRVSLQAVMQGVSSATNLEPGSAQPVDAEGLAELVTAFRAGTFPPREMRAQPHKDYPHLRVTINMPAKALEALGRATSLCGGPVAWATVLLLDEIFELIPNEGYDDPPGDPR